VQLSQSVPVSARRRILHRHHSSSVVVKHLASL
jgi:hypothetical protein